MNTGKRPYPKHPIFFINCKECGKRVASINVKCSDEPWKYVCDKCYEELTGKTAPDLQQYIIDPVVKHFRKR